MSDLCPFTTSLFIGSTLLYISHIRKKISRDSNSDEYERGDCSANDGCGNSSQPRLIGSRGNVALTPVLPYLNAFFKCLEDPCDPEDNPEGHIALCVAENTLVQEVLATRLMRSGTATNSFSDSVAYCYNGMLGLPVAREAVAYFLEKRFLCVQGNDSSDHDLDTTNHDNIDRNDKINPEHIAIGAGAASILNNLFFTIAEPGEGVLVPAPFYAAFVNDMKVVAGCVPIPVQCRDPVRGPTIEELEVASDMAEKNILKKGKKVKMLLLTNPNNPLGTVYSPNVVMSAINWAKSRKMHTIMDEIYALSVQSSSDHRDSYPLSLDQKQSSNEFISVINLLDNDLGDDVHFVWALSKDFGASGFRIGILYTQNELVLRALSNLNIFSCVSHPMQLIMADFLVDDNFIDAFLVESRSRLQKSYELCISKLEEMVIDYVPVQAGIFVYCDFSSLLPEQTFAAETKLREIIEKYARVVMTPGESQFDRKPGRFRICYAWVSLDVLAIAMERLSYLITKLRKMDWLYEIHEEYFCDVVSGAIQRLEKRRRFISHRDSIDLSKAMRG